MSKKKSEFIVVDTVSDSQYIPVFGDGADRAISKPNLFQQIKDESFSPFIYPTIELLQAADLEADEDNPTYVRCEETEYRLYKITNLAPGVDDISLANGNTATFQVEYRDIGFVIGPTTSVAGSLAVFTDTGGAQLDDLLVPTNAGKAFMQAADSGAVTFPRKNADNTLSMLGASTYFDAIKQSSAVGYSGTIETASDTSTLLQVATDEAITPSNLAALKAASAEVIAGTNQVKYVTPETLQDKLEADSTIIIENVAALASTPVVAGTVYYLKEYNANQGVGGGDLRGHSGSITPDNAVTFNGSGGYFRRINYVFDIDMAGGVGDGVTNNNDVFDRIQASGEKDCYIPDGEYYTEAPFENLDNVNFYGIGRITTPTDAFPANFSIVSTAPTIVGPGLPDYFEGETVFKNKQEYYIQKTGRYGLTQPYFAAEGNPHFAIFDNRTGASGTDAHLDADCIVGATSMTLKYTNVGFPNGTVFVMDDGLGHSQQFTSTGTSGSFVVNFTPPVSGSTFPASPGFTTVKKANRTQNVYSHVEVYHNGGGDGYGQCWRIYNGYNQATTAQYHFFQTATAGMYNGDISATANGVYLQVSETNIADLGYDVAAIAEVRSYDRTNDTGNRYAFWADRLIKSEGTKKMDFGSVYVGKFNVVLDFGGVTDTDCMIGMKTEQRIYYNNSQTIIPGNPFPIGYNTKGNIYTQSDSTGTVFEIWNNSNRWRFSSSGALITPGYLSVATTVAVPTNGKVSLNSANDQTYLTYDGTTIRLFKAGVQVASW